MKLKYKHDYIESLLIKVKKEIDKELYDPSPRYGERNYFEIIKSIEEILNEIKLFIPVNV